MVSGKQVRDALMLAALVFGLNWIVMHSIRKAVGADKSDSDFEVIRRLLYGDSKPYYPRNR